MNSKDFDECIEKAKAEQRQMCASKIQQCVLADKKLNPSLSELTNACLNATGESDEYRP